MACFCLFWKLACIIMVSRFYSLATFYQLLLWHFEICSFSLFFRHQMTPLMYACQHNRASVAQLLLANGADAYIKDIRGWTVS